MIGRMKQVYKPTILDNNLESLYRQTEMNSDNGYLEKTTPISITKPMKLGTYPVYSKTSQLESDLRYSGTGETQPYLYPPLKVSRPEPIYKSDFNYGIHQNITTKPIDVSGTMIQNDKLQVRTNRGTNAMNRPQIIGK